MSGLNWFCAGDGAFARKSGGESARDLGEVVRDLREWLWPLLRGVERTKDAEE